MHIGHGPTAWATADHRAILDACKAGERDAAGRLLAQHFARTAFEVIAELEPAYEAARLNEALADVAADARR